MSKEFEFRVLQLLGGNNAKLSTIQSSPGYTREFSYSGATGNIIEIKHSAVTDEGLLTVIQTIEYENPAVDGSRITKIIIS